jgi:hypothetical protein
MKIEDENICKGHCLCGAVSYEVKGDPIIIAHCHCEDCQRTSGAGHSTGAMYPIDRFQLFGKISEYQLVSDNGNKVTKSFCPTCGSPVCGRNSGMDGFVTLSLGTMNDSSKFVPEVTIFDRNRKPWDNLDESTEVFDAQPGWSPKGKI